MFEQGWQHRAHRLAAAAAADGDGLARQLALGAGLRRAKHQLGPEQVERGRGRSSAEQAQIDPARAGLQAGARRQQCRAAHAIAIDRDILAAEHQQVAVVALVRTMALLTRRARLGVRRVEPGIGRQLIGGDAEPVKPDLAGRVPAVGGEQSGLERQQRQGVTRPGRAGREGIEPGAAVALQPAGQVHAQHGRAGLLQGLHPVGHRARPEAAATQAQQRVDAEVEVLGRPVGKLQAGRAGLLQCVAGVVGQAAFVAMPADRQACLRQLRPQQGSCQQSVTAVVAGSAGEPDMACMWLQCPRQGGNRGSGPLHQPVWRQVRERGLFDRAAGGAAVQRELGSARPGV